MSISKDFINVSGDEMDRAQLDLSQTYLADGSGLSHYNLLTVRQLLDVLLYMYRHDDALRLLQHLPVAGVDGTLRRRRSLRRLQGKIKAKTGTIKHVSSLAGFLTTRAGDDLAFVLLVNGYLPPQATLTRPESRSRASLEHFERELFRHLFEISVK